MTANKWKVFVKLFAQIFGNLERKRIFFQEKNLKDANDAEFPEKFLKKIFKEIDEWAKKLEFEMYQYEKMLANKEPIRFTQYASEIFWPDWKKL